MDRLVIVGAGPHGLAVLAALAAGGSWPRQVTVVDPHRRWCHAWDEKLARLELDRLRSPQVHHPGVRPMALRDLVERQAGAARDALRVPGDDGVPTPAGMRGLIDELAADLGPVAWQQSLVRTIDLDGGEATLHLEDGVELTADAVVLAHGAAVPRIPDWAAGLVASGRARHADSIDLRDEDLAGRKVVVVGGGLTAASLALAVARGGGKAKVVTRMPLRPRPYDVDAGWLGPRRLDRFHDADFTERRALIDVARDGGTIPPVVLGELRERDAAHDGVYLREAVDDLSSEVRCMVCTDNPPELWLATGYEHDVRSDALLGPIVDDLDTPVHHGLPELTDDLRVPGSNVFVAGAYAALVTGPASRNLAGTRPVAARIAAGLAAGHPVAAR